MAEILPLKAWRYADNYKENIEALTAPLFDVVSSQQREELYKNSLNAIHLSVPKGPDPIENAKNTLIEWKGKGIIKQDLIPGIYVYYQYFRLPGEEKERCRKGFIAQIKAYNWEEGEILRHENTIVSAVTDRVDLLAATKIQASPTHGLYEDEDFQLEQYMDASMASPIYEVEDYQGVREVLSVIHDAKVIRKFLMVIARKQIILADGHHRIEGAIAYRKRMRGQFEDKRWKAHEYHLMYLTNAASDDLKILPTHRLFYGLQLSQAQLFEKLRQWFEIKPFSDPEELGTYTFRRVRKFGLLIGEEGYLIELKQELYDSINRDMPEALRKLDLVLLHEVLFHQILEIPIKEQRSKENLVYERNFSKCLREVQSGKASFAIITRELEMSQVLDVCKSGLLMPQKSTYFYPKALSGLVFASIDQEEFEYNYDAFFE
ncbi:Uncharacterized conserved protein, DUF1015 family [Algoriphagus faecimaris]|uniref:Uncharacterized conserved protein, DUF1015 family n=1 Tax=Algoriphagus faecimaris TaxID=686796 RepID=A0A1G6VF71_9BACT|nr:DUF1015 domain-containing protein [Algoriphagus faecimaris]SDD52340.1 Uncharacterized conserved protein, DUF1015 family [Algoriphagus faecimaris]